MYVIGVTEQAVIEIITQLCLCNKLSEAVLTSTHTLCFGGRISFAPKSYSDLV